MQNDSSRLNSLKLELAEAMDLSALFHSREFQTRWLPLLVKDSQQTWLDPLKFPNQEEFQRAYNMAYAKSVVANSWLAFFEKQDARVEALRKAIDTPEKNYGI